MEKLPWLEYGGQTTEELLSLEGQYRTDSIVCAFEQALLQKTGTNDGADLSAEEQVVLAVEALEREVNNGGYSQFFINSSVFFVPVVVQALEAIQCPHVAALTKRAIDCLGILEPLSAEAIDAVMREDDDERESRLAVCDEEYYETAGDLAEPLLDFIKKHRDTILCVA